MNGEAVESPSISIVIPVLNDADVLATLLDELKDTRHEVIVVDGGSTDDSERVARTRGAQWLQSPKGRARQLQAGIDHASGDWIWMLHADVSMVGNALARLDALTDICWGRFDVRLGGDAPAFRVIEAMMNHRSALTHICTGDQGIFCHRHLLEAIGGIPDQPLMEDIELSKRLRRLAKPLRLRERITASSRRWQRDGIPATVLLMWQLRLRYFIGTDPTHLARAYYGPDLPEPH